MSRVNNSGHNQDQGLARDVDVDFHGLFANIWAKKFRIVIYALLAFILLFFVLAMIPPKYQSVARVLIENRESVFTRSETDNSTPSFDREAIISQAEIMRADRVALEVIKELNLEDEVVLSKPLSIFSTARLNSMFGFGRDGSVKAPSKQERTLMRFRENLDVSAVRDSRVIQVKFKSKSATLARDVPNAVARQYLNELKKSNLKNTEGATEFLGPEVEQLRQRVRAAEAKVAEYRASSNILQGRDNATLATQQLSETSTELSRLRADRASAVGKISAIRSAMQNGASLDVIPEVIASPLIQRLREGEAQLRAEISELETTLLPNHPQLKALKSQVANYRSQILSAARDILASLENNVTTAKRQENDLLSQLNSLKAESARVDEAAVELRVLEREAAAERGQLETYLRNFREASSRQNNLYEPVNAQIFSLANLPTEPYFPLIFPFALAGALLVMILHMAGIATSSLLSGAALTSPAPQPLQVATTTAPVEPAETAKTAAPVAPTPDNAPRSILDTNQPPNTSFLEESTPERPLPAAIQSPGEVKLMQTGDAADEAIEPGAAETSLLKKPNLAKLLNRIGLENSMPKALSKAQKSKTSSTAPVTANANGDGLSPLKKDGDSLQDVTFALSTSNAKRVILVSPGTEQLPAVSAHLAASIAKRGGSCVIVDMSACGCCSREMLPDIGSAGIRDVLSCQAQLSDVVYQSRVANVHIVPIGAGELSAAPDAILGRLNIILNALQGRYDRVILDCGKSQIENISRIASAEDTLLVNAIGSTKDDQEHFARALRDLGYRFVLKVTPAKHELAALENAA